MTVHGKERRTAVLFDGLCLLCQRSCRVLHRLDWLHRLDFVDLRDWPTVERRFPVLNRSLCAKELHVVFPNGRVRSGFDAVRALLWFLPPVAIFAPLLYIPGAPSIGQRLYIRVATRRHRFRTTAI